MLLTDEQIALFVGGTAHIKLKSEGKEWLARVTNFEQYTDTHPAAPQASDLQQIYIATQPITTGYEPWGYLINLDGNNGTLRKEADGHFCLHVPYDEITIIFEPVGFEEGLQKLPYTS